MSYPINPFAPLALTSISQPSDAQMRFDLKDREFRLLILMLLNDISIGIGGGGTGVSNTVDVTDAGQGLSAASAHDRKVSFFNHGPAVVYVNPVEAVATPGAQKGIKIPVGGLYENPLRSAEAWHAETTAGTTARVTVIVW